MCIRDSWGSGQSGDEHIGPVSFQGICGCMEGRDAIFELFNGVFLVASLVDQPDELVIWSFVIIGDLEEVSDLMINDFAAFGDLQIFFQRDDPIRLFTFDGSIGE